MLVGRSLASDSVRPLDASLSLIDIHFTGTIASIHITAGGVMANFMHSSGNWSAFPSLGLLVGLGVRIGTKYGNFFEFTLDAWEFPAFASGLP